MGIGIGVEGFDMEDGGMGCGVWGMMADNGWGVGCGVWGLSKVGGENKGGADGTTHSQLNVTLHN